MNKHCVNWKPSKFKNVRGTDIDTQFPALVDTAYKGTLISRVLKMEKKQPVDFMQAIYWAQEKWLEAFDSGNIGSKPGQCLWYHQHFVEWIAGLGYHIELTGDEFEPYAMSDQIN